MGNLNIQVCVLGMVSTNCYIVYRKSNGQSQEAGSREELKPGVILDPGDNASFILNKCRELSVRPEAVLLTHGHFDHILAVEDIRRTFHVPVFVGEKEMRLLKEPKINLSVFFGDPVSVTADRWLKDGEILELAGCRWKVIDTPGHTAGSLCFYVEEEGVLFSGDTLFKGSVGRTDLPTASPECIIDSVNRKLLILPDETRVYPGHDDETTIGYEKRYNMVSHCR